MGSAIQILIALFVNGSSGREKEQVKDTICKIISVTPFSRVALPTTCSPFRSPTKEIKIPPKCDCSPGTISPTKRSVQVIDEWGEHTVFVNYSHNHLLAMMAIIIPPLPQPVDEEKVNDPVKVHSLQNARCDDGWLCDVLKCKFLCDHLPIGGVFFAKWIYMRMRRAVRLRICHLVTKW